MDVRDRFDDGGDGAAFQLDPHQAVGALAFLHRDHPRSVGAGRRVGQAGALLTIESESRLRYGLDKFPEDRVEDCHVRIFDQLHVVRGHNDAQVGQSA